MSDTGRDRDGRVSRLVTPSHVTSKGSGADGILRVTARVDSV